VLSLGVTSRVSGLAIDVRPYALPQLETVAGKAAITTLALSDTACPRPLSTCGFTLHDTKAYAGSFTHDARRGLHYVSSSLFQDVLPDNRLLVLREGSCIQVCELKMPDCAAVPLGSIRALALDPCADLLYASDGQLTATYKLSADTTNRCVKLELQACCRFNHPSGEVWCGFAWRGRPEQPVGKSCTERSCAACPALALRRFGEPVLGNQRFALRFEAAPTGSIGFLYLGLGPCAALPILCGELYIAGPLLLLDAIPLTGTALCDGAGHLALPIPTDHALCGGVLCLQGLVVCLTAQPIGVGLTNGQLVRLGW
jgi:hypothetical protein